MRRYLTKFDAVMRDALAREFGVDPKVLWDVLDGKPGPPRFVQGLLGSMSPRLKVEELGEPYDDGLTSQHEHNTIESVDATTSVLRSRGVRRAKGAPETKASRATEAAGLTYAEIGAMLTKKLGRPFHVNSVQAWHKKKDDPAYRRIPDDAATELEKTGVPRSVWPGIIPPK